jgi:hypothetical protein
MTESQSLAPPRSHRGKMLLTFGLLALPIWPFGIAAWMMSNTDLKAMANGKMDPSGLRLTRAGKILGILGLILNLLWMARMSLAHEAAMNAAKLPIH